MNYKDFGKNIRILRKKKGLKISDIAAALNIHTSYLGQIERGIKIPSVNVAVNLVNYFEINFQSVFISIEDEYTLLHNEILQHILKLEHYEKQFIYKTLLEII